MKKFASIIISAAVFALVLVPSVIPAVAQDDPDLGPPLTKARAESFVACLGDIIEIGKEYEGEYAGASLFGNESSDMESAIAAMSGHPAYSELMSTLRKHGFDDAEDWAQTSRRFISAYSALKLKNEGTDVDAEMAKAIGQIRENTMLTDEQKDQMIEMIKSQQQMFEELQDDASAADRAAVEAVMEEFEQLSEQQ